MDFWNLIGYIGLDFGNFEQFNERIIPIEVKSGTKGSMQSLHLFLEEKHHPYGFRLSLENFGQVEKIKIMPIYAAFLMKNLIKE